MFASQGAYLLGNTNIISILILLILLFFIVNYILGRFIGRLLKLPYEDVVSLNMTIIARNSPIALAIVSQLILFTKRKIDKGSEPA